jgi:hypothetical protein
VNVTALSGSVFWLTPSELWGISASGGQPMPIASGTAPAFLGNDGQRVFFETGGNVSWCLATLDACTPTAVFPQSLQALSGLALGNGLVYALTSTEVLTCPFVGCSPPTTVTSGLFGLTSIAVSPAGLFIGDTGGQILACPLGGSCASPEVIAANETNPSSMLVDGKMLYWLSPVPGGRVKRCDATMCGLTETVLADGQNTPTAMVADETYVYFTVTGEGAVKRVGK